MIQLATPAKLKELQHKAALSRGDIVAMTYLAGSGHPGGSMSSIDIYTILYNLIDPATDQVVISHGHTSPGVYSALARAGKFDPQQVIKGFRRVGSVFEGHVEPTVPGVPWGTGNLGQGLSVAAGLALAARIRERKSDFFVVMGDGEQQKGQISEARRFLKKYNLNNVTVIVDFNRLQISGDCDQVMPQDLKAEYEAAGFKVIEVDGHDYNALYDALVKASTDKNQPYCLLARTVMGKGVSFMENKAKYHGSPVAEADIEKAFSELELEWPLDELRKLRTEPIAEDIPEHSWPYPEIEPGAPRVYAADVKTDNRSAFGAALVEVSLLNSDRPIAVFDCDLAGSVKTDGFAKAFPERFFQIGIAEHHAVVTAGALASQNCVGIFADFGMFGIDETYNQQRLNGVNATHMKQFCTHVGIDVGEDGKTHQCIDYLGLMRNIPDYKLIVPCDPNETDRATRYALATPGNILVAMGRSKLPIITDADGNAFFGGSVWSYGQAHHFRSGNQATLFALGAMSIPALEAWKVLQAKGLNVEVVGISCPLAIAAEEIAAASQRGPVFVVEDHLSSSGLAAQLAYQAALAGLRLEIIPMGANGFPPSGPSNDCYAKLGLDSQSIAQRIENKLR